MKNKLTIIKVGGRVLNDKNIFEKFLFNFSKINGKKILVHGGGIIASNYLIRLGIVPKLINGRRITDEKTLDVSIMTYAGLINKTIVSNLQKNNCNSIGLSGVDCNLIKAKKREINDIDYGLAGDIEKININFINTLLSKNITPVICSLSHDGKGQILNTNADSIASHLSVEMSNYYNVSLKYCFDKAGVLSDQKKSSSLIKNINLSGYKGLIKEKIITDGMIPKLDNCFYALRNGVNSISIGDHNVITNKKNYTKITLD